MGLYPPFLRERPGGGLDRLEVWPDGVRPGPAGTVWAISFRENGREVRPGREAMARAQSLLRDPALDSRVLEELALRMTVAREWGAVAAGLAFEARPIRMMDRAFWEVRAALPMGRLVPWLASQLGEIRELSPPHRRWGEGGKFRDGFLTPPVPDPLPTLRGALEALGGELRISPLPEDPASALLAAARALFGALHRGSPMQTLRQWDQVEALAERFQALLGQAREDLPVLMVWPGREAAAARLAALLDRLEETPSDLLPRTRAELTALRERMGPDPKPHPGSRMRFRPPPDPE